MKSRVLIFFFLKTVLPNGTLVITDVHRSDAGNYRCRVKTSGGTTEANLVLKVLELPRATVYPPSLYFVTGNSFNISCYTSGKFSYFAMQIVVLLTVGLKQ